MTDNDFSIQIEFADYTNAFRFYHETLLPEFNKRFGIVPDSLFIGMSGDIIVGFKEDTFVNEFEISQVVYYLNDLEDDCEIYDWWFLKKITIDTENESKKSKYRYAEFR